jgi:hypothetical protein
LLSLMQNPLQKKVMETSCHCFFLLFKYRKEGNGNYRCFPWCKTTTEEGDGNKLPLFFSSFQTQKRRWQQLVVITFLAATIAQKDRRGR